MRKSLQQSVIVVLTIALGAVGSLRPARGDSWQLTVRGTETNLGETPVIVRLNQEMPLGIYRADLSSGEALTAQVFEDKGQRCLGTVFPCVEARKTVTYVLKGPAASRIGFSERSLI